MSPEQIESAFKAFERGSDPFVRASEGVGLGLALCSEIMRAHGGDIAMASRLGEGTTATARLPFDRVVLDLDAARYACGASSPCHPIQTSQTERGRALPSPKRAPPPSDGHPGQATASSASRDIWGGPRPET